ncbi:MAG: amino acid permease [Myxococcota bacterium]|nr:amino acid permease [Myxococcota bacterium]
MKTLQRGLGLWGAVSLSLSAMLGPGAFVVCGLAVAQTGGTAWLAYLCAALILLPAALSKAELSSAIPRSGGTYVYIFQAFGPFAGTSMGLGLWASLFLKSAFALMGVGAYLATLGDIPLKPVALGFLVLILVLNLRGIKAVSNVQTPIVLLSIVLLFGLMAMATGDFKASNFDPIMPAGFLGFVGTVGFVFMDYAGVTKIAAVAGEVKDPARNLPKGILVSLALITPIYVCLSFVLCGVLEAEGLVGNYSSIHTLAVHLSGPSFGVFVSVVGVLIMAAMANSGLLAASRFPFAMSRDQLMPNFFGFIHRDTVTPVWSILVTAILMGSTILWVDIPEIIKLASALKILAFSANCLAVLVLRESKAQWYQPKYRSPLYPGIQIFGVMGGGVLLFALGQATLHACAAILTIGGCVYLTYGWRKSTEKGVLGKMIRREDLKRELGPEIQEIQSVMPTEAAAIVALVGRERSVEMLTQLGTALSQGQRVEVVHITEIPSPIALDDLLDEDNTVAAIRRRVLGMREISNVDVRFDPVVSHDTVETVHTLSAQLHCDWLVMRWRNFRLLNPLGWLVNHLHSDLALFRDVGIRYLRKILVLVEPGDLDPMAVVVAYNLAKYYRATITVGQFAPKSFSEADVEGARNYLKQLTHLCPAVTDQVVVQGTSEEDCVATLTEGFDLMVLGSHPHSRVSNIFLKTREDKLCEGAVCSVLLMKSPKADKYHQAVARMREEFHLLPFLEKDTIRLGLNVLNKEELFLSLAQQFVATGVKINVGAVNDAFWERERLRNTAVSRGVAMPHAALVGLERTYLIVSVLDEPIEYGHGEELQEIDIVFATVGPAVSREHHLFLIGALSKMAVHTNLLENLRRVVSVEDAWELFRNCSEQAV